MDVDTIVNSFMNVRTGPVPILRKRVSILVAAFNEERDLQGAVSAILDAAHRVLEDFEILIVDDGSSDRTGEIADRMSREDRRIRAFHHPRNRGLRAVYATALAEARMDYFIFLAGDNEIHPDSIRDILDATGSADIVIPFHGNPAARPWHRRLMTFVCTTALNALLGNRLRYYQGPNIYPTALARALPRTTKGFFFLAQMTAHAIRLGYTFRHVGLIHQERAHGTSKAVSLRNIRRALRTILVLGWQLGVNRRRITLPPQVLPPGRATIDGKWRRIGERAEDLFRESRVI